MRLSRFLLSAVVAAALLLVGAVAELRAQTGGQTGGTAQGEVVNIRLGDHGAMTRFVVDLSAFVPFHLESRATPTQLVLDLADTGWRAGAVPPGLSRDGLGLVQRHRYELPGDGVLRLVIDLTRPFRVREAFLLSAGNGQPPRLVIDIEPAATVTAQRLGTGGQSLTARGRIDAVALAETAPPAPAATPRILVSDAVNGHRPASDTQVAALPPSPPPARTVDAPAPAAPAAAPSPEAPLLAAYPLPPPTPERVRQPRVIVIDAGHGGIDPGAIGPSGIMEKEITLAIARRLHAALGDREHYRVILTRDGDQMIRLRERVRIARDANADLFLSLHADSIGNAQVRGASIYTLSDVASDREAEQLAARENRADALGGVALAEQDDLMASILIDLAQRLTRNESKSFADLLVERLGRETRMLPNPHRQAGFAVLTAPDVPSVLVELGYLSSRADEQALSSPEHQARLVEAIAEAIDAYFAWLEDVHRS